MGQHKKKAAETKKLEKNREDLTWDENIDYILSEIRELYNKDLEPLEQRFSYSVFSEGNYADTIYQRRPLVTLTGPFSVGKTEFINYLTESTHLLTGPQPVTDKFTVIMYGEEFERISGSVLLADPKLPFRDLNQFGDAFAEFFSAVLIPHPILRYVSFVDMPGILETAESFRSRRYDYTKVIRWFASHSELLLFLFDPTKLDAGEELCTIFKNSLKGFEGKMRVVLNKADSVDPQSLIRVYGSLFWNLSNLIKATEPPRVFVSSLWAKPYAPGTDHELFNAEKKDLLTDILETVPLQFLNNRVTTFLKRVSDVCFFMIICASYKSRMPILFGKSRAQKRFFENYEQITTDLAKQYKFSPLNAPNSEEIETFLRKMGYKHFYDIGKLEKDGYIKKLREIIEEKIPNLLFRVKQTTEGDPRFKGAIMDITKNYLN